MTKIEILLQSRKNIFSFDDLMVYWQITQISKLKNNIKYYIKTGDLIPIRRGVYRLGINNNSKTGITDLLSIAQKLVPFSYISLFTALHIHGINFQYYNTIFSISNKSKNICINNQEYSFHKIRDTAAFDMQGILQKDNYLLASPERAICDTLYLFPKSGFDYIESIDQKKLQEIALIYNNKTLIKKINKLCSI